MGFESAQQLIDNMLSLMPDPALVVDETGAITHVNEALVTLFGYDHGELDGQRVEALVPDRLRSVHRVHRGEFAAGPRPRAMGAGLELFGRRRDGSEFPVDISLAPLALPGETSTVASIRDVTDRLEIEAARAQLAAIVEGSGDAIFALGLDGVVRSWNPGAHRTLEYERHEVVGSHVSALVPDASAVEFEDQLGAAMAGEQRAGSDIELVTKSGGLVPVAVVVSPLQIEGGAVTGFSVVARDITERALAERELRRLLAETERSARWQDITAEIRLRILDGADINDVLALVCDRLGELMGAKGVAAILGEPPTVRVASGQASALVDAFDPAWVPHPDQVGPDIVPAASLDPQMNELTGEVDALVVPIRPGADRAGSLLCLIDDPDEAAEAMAVSFAEQMAVALELDQAKSERDLLLIGDERGRIARDLHDLVIQRLFASGLSLQSVLPLVRDERASTRLIEVVDELDTTIREIRTTIFTLAPPSHTSSGLRAEVLGLVDESTRLLGFEAATRFRGPVDTAVGAAQAPHVVAVIREALANVARHADAHSARVEVAASADTLEVVVVDDGVGPPAGGRESGLRNLRQRAEELGGRLSLEPGDRGGTVLTWTVPLGTSGRG